MANRNNNFEIPIPLIVLAYIFYWPVGIVLTILRVISSSQKKQDAANRQQSAAEMRADFERRMEADAARRQAEQNRIYASERRKARTQYETNASQRKQTQNAEPIVTNPYYREQVDRKAAKQAQSSGAYAGLIAGGVIAAVIAGMSLLIGGLAVDTGISLLGVVGIPLLIAAAFFVGAKLYKNRQVELSRIKKIIGQKESYNLSKLASASGKSLKKLRKQLQKMIDKGEFGDSAYIDLGSNNFMRHPDASPDDPEGFDYKTVYGDLFAKKKAAEGEEETAEEPEDDSDEARFAKIIAEIRRLNDRIEDVPVSERIDRIEGYTRHIFEYVTEHPDAMPQIRTFMNYYLPTTLKLLESYSRIERVGVAGENMKKSKENIESILDLLVVGFEQQIDQLFRNESIDITADISVLETMMQKDGLSGKNDFDIASFVDSYSDEITDDVSDELGGAAAMKAPEDK